MRHALMAAAAGTAVAGVTLASLWAWGADTVRAQAPGGDMSAADVHVMASVDSVQVNPPGNRTPNFLMTFSHAAQMSGSYSVTVDGGPITSGQAVAGFILGCGISVAGGVTVGIEPNQGLAAAIAPSVTPGSTSVSPPSGTEVTPGSTSVSPPSGTVTPSASVTPPDISLGPSVGGALGVTEVLTATMGPGQVTTATTATAALDSATEWPYQIAFNNAALNVAQCASPVSAVPFVTTTVATPRGVVQTTAYGDQFTF
ncbi:MspA family porin [Nocardia sp. NPDC005746]|uniref:MspA family porin n=1 Tax=unclassified Nocardia TaxID=2637762 RepID=UPI00340FB376